MPKTKSKNKIEKLLLQNFEELQKVERKVSLLEREFRKAQAVNFVRFIIVAVPVVLAVLYLIPLFRQFIEMYQPLVDFVNSFRL